MKKLVSAKLAGNILLGQELGLRSAITVVLSILAFRLAIEK